MFIFQLIIIQVITFVALVFVLRKIMYSSSYMETRRLQMLNQENAKKAEELQLKIEEAHKQYQEKIALAEDESRKLKLKAQQDIEKIKDEMLVKARQESERIIEKALNAKERVREEMDAKVAEKGIEFSLKLFAEVLNSKSQSLLHEGLVNQVIEDLDKLQSGRLQVNIDKGELILAREIKPEKKEKILNILKEKTGKNIILEERIDQGIIAGVSIKLGSMVIDASLAEKLREAGEKLSKA